MKQTLKAIWLRISFLVIVSLWTLLGIYLFLSSHLYWNALLMILVPPLSLFLTIGSFKDRLLNSLSLWTWWVYFHLGFAFQWWNEANILFFLVAFIGFIFLPKRTIIHYLVFFLTITYWIVGWISGYWIPSLIRWFFILIIYLVFYPPLVKKKWRQSMRLPPFIQNMLRRQK